MPRRRRWNWKRWGERVKRERLSREWSQQDLADSLGVARVTIARLEVGTRRPSVEMLDRLAAVFRLPLEEFVREARG